MYFNTKYGSYTDALNSGKKDALLVISTLFMVSFLFDYFA